MAREDIRVCDFIDHNRGEVFLPGFDDYTVDINGTVCHVKLRWDNTYLNFHLYHRTIVIPYLNHGQAMITIHQRHYNVSPLIYKAFGGEIWPGEIIFHKDGDPRNLNPRNLMKGTKKDRYSYFREGS